MANKFSVEVALVESLLLACDYQKGVASLVGEQLSSYLGRCEASAVAANKAGRMVTLGKADKDMNGDVRFLALKSAKRDLNYLPCRLLVIADAQIAFSKATGIPTDEVCFTLPESVRGLLAGLEAQGKAKYEVMVAKLKAEKEKEEALQARQELAAQLLEEHDKQMEAAKVKAAQAITA